MGGYNVHLTYSKSILHSLSFIKNTYIWLLYIMQCKLMCETADVLLYTIVYVI